MELNAHTTNGYRGYILGDFDAYKDMSLDSTWRSDAFAGSKTITIVAHTITRREAILMRAKVAEEGTKLRMVVKLDGE